MERAQWGEDQDQIGDQSHYAQLGGDLQVGVVSQLFFDRVDVEIAYAYADDGAMDGYRGGPLHQFATQLGRARLILIIAKNRRYPGPVTARHDREQSSADQHGRQYGFQPAP